MKVTVLFFGAAKEIVGMEQIEFDLTPQISASVAFRQILQTYPALLEKFGKSLLFAVNQNYATGDETVNEGDEMAIFPPVSGGSDEIRNPKSEIRKDFLS